MSRIWAPQTTLPGLIVLSTLLAGNGCGSSSIPVPTSYAKFNAPDGTFQCDYPAGRESSTGGMPGQLRTASFTRGGASIHVTADLAGSLLGDIARSGSGLASGMAGVEEQRIPPVEALHEMGLRSAEEEISNYKEQPHETIQSQLGDARRSEFTGTAGVLQQKIHGYRTTVLGTQRRFTIICKCPESDWKALQPALDRVISSLAPGE